MQLVLKKVALVRLDRSRLKHASKVWNSDTTRQIVAARMVGLSCGENADRKVM